MPPAATDSYGSSDSGLSAAPCGRTKRRVTANSSRWKPAAQATFLKGAQVVVEAMLQSPNFLFHVEPGVDPAQRQYAIANRLSYFLWDTMPDQALLQAAGAGQLSTKAQIRTQIERLLASPQAKSAMEEFLAQWLRYDRLRSAFREVRLYPEFSSELVSSMLEETRRLFDHLVWGDRNFLEFFTADYAFLSADLAQLYGLPAPPEPFAKVDVSRRTARAAACLAKPLF